MREQAEIAMDMADVICFFADARDGLTDDDRDVALLLRKTGCTPGGGAHLFGVRIDSAHDAGNYLIITRKIHYGTD